MSILITGGVGYIGSHTTVELLSAGFDVVLVDDFSNSSPAVLERLEKITDKKFPFYQGSILDTDFLDKVKKENISALREVVKIAADAGVPTPTLSAALNYLESIFRWLPPRPCRARSLTSRSPPGCRSPCPAGASSPCRPHWPKMRPDSRHQLRAKRT